MATGLETRHDLQGARPLLGFRASDRRLTMREEFEITSRRVVSPTLVAKTKPLALDVPSMALVKQGSLRQLLIYRLNGTLSVIFVTDCKTDDEAVQKADAIAALGFRVEVWRDGSEVQRENSTRSRSTPCCGTRPS
jgi:hypothetical protein